MQMEQNCNPIYFTLISFLFLSSLPEYITYQVSNARASAQDNLKQKRSTVIDFCFSSH